MIVEHGTTPRTKYTTNDFLDLSLDGLDGTKVECSFLRIREAFVIPVFGVPASCILVQAFAEQRIVRVGTQSESSLYQVQSVECRSSKQLVASNTRDRGVAFKA